MFFRGFPFDNGKQGANSRSKKPVERKLYDVLGLKPDSTDAEIRRAYRKLALEKHPDKGGDPEEFAQVSRAYEVLADAQQRARYDELGDDRFENQGGADAQDIFDMFFGGGGGGRSRVKRGEDVVSRLKVSLEQLYNGATRKLAINRDSICGGCQGHGGPQNEFKTCAECNGQGFRVHIRQMGPMIQQTQSVCSECRGQGKSIAESSKCKECRGTGCVKERKILEVRIESGMVNGQKITFEKEADQRRGEVAGNVVFVLEAEEHSRFTRRGNDLIFQAPLLLSEALLGFTLVVEHLDKRQLVVKRDRSRVVSPGEMAVIEREGMTEFRNPSRKGNLFIAFDIKFPMASEINDQRAAVLAEVLPASRKLEIDEKGENVEVHEAEIVDADSYLRKERSRGAHEPSEDEGASQGVQCRQQ